MLIRRYRSKDAGALWRILEPVVRAGETYALPRDMPKGSVLAYWTGPDRETFVAELEGAIAGTYYLRANQAGGGAHVANCGYVTAGDFAGRGIARAMCRDSMTRAREQGFRAMQFNLVVSTNAPAIRLWQSLMFETAGRLPGAFAHPALGDVDALVMYRRL